MTTIVDVEFRVIEPPSEKGWVFAALALTAAWFVYAIPWLFQGMVIPWDSKDFYYPVLRFLAASLAQGEPGEWNPYLYSGFPAIADPQSWYFTPTFRFFASVNAAPSMTAMDAVELLHLLFGAFGLLLLCRRIGVRPVAATLAGLVFMFGGVAASRLQHTIMVVSYAYLPWALLLLTIACDSPFRYRRLLAAAGFGLVAGLMAVDRDQVAFLNCLLLIVVAIWQVARRLWPRPLTALWTALELTPALVVGLLVLAVPMLLTLDFLAMSTRPEIDYTAAGYASLQPAAFLTLLDPNFYSELERTGYWGPGELPWMSLSALGYDWTAMPTSHIYIGLVPLALLAIGFTIRKPGDPYHRLFIGTFVLSVLYAIGAYTPVFRFIYDWVPGVDLYRRPNDAAFLVNFGFAMLVGFAAQAVLTLDDESARVSKLKFALMVLCLLAAALAALWIGAYFDHGEDAARAVIIAVPLLLILGVLIAWGRSRLPFWIFASGLVVLTAADLIWNHSGAAFSAHPVESIKAYRPESVALANAIRARLGTGTERGRAAIFGLGGSWQNAPMVYQIEQTLGYDPMRWAAYEKAMGSDQNSHLNERKLTERFTGYDSRLAKRLGVRMVVSGAPIDTILPREAYESLKFLGPLGDAYLYQNADVAPRAVVAPLGTPDEAKAAAGTIVMIPETSPDDAPLGQAEIVSYHQSQVVVHVTLEKPGLLILHDIYHPAWKAWRGSEPVPVLRANGLFRAVALPAGEHTVTFSFEPLNWSELIEAAHRVIAAYGSRE